MNPTTLHEPAELGRVGTWLSQAVWPDRTEDDDRDRLVTARRVAGALTVVGTLVQVVVWMLIAVFTGGLDMPWWLYTLAGGGVVMFTLRLADALRHDVRQEVRR